MSKKKISVLISYPDHFEVTEITPDLAILQKIVGGYIEAVPRPSANSGWFAYCNEDGKANGLPFNHASNKFLDKLYTFEGATPFTHFDAVVGNLIWLSDSGDGTEASLPIVYVKHYTDSHLASGRERAGFGSPVITIVRDGSDLWVFDQHAPVPQRISELVKAARSRADHGTIEVWSGISPAKWVELRVEIMDDITITLHDERDDRSYG